MTTTKNTRTRKPKTPDLGDVLVKLFSIWDTREAFDADLAKAKAAIAAAVEADEDDELANANPRALLRDPSLPVEERPPVRLPKRNGAARRVHQVEGRA
jgi:hypothetical protein